VTGLPTGPRGGGLRAGDLPVAGSPDRQRPVPVAAGQQSPPSHGDRAYRPDTAVVAFEQPTPGDQRLRYGERPPEDRLESARSV